MAPPEQATDIINRWLGFLENFDLDALVDMYDQHAELTSWHETWKGRDEIQDGLTFARRWIRGIRLDDLGRFDVQGDAMVFDTTVRGKLGRTRVRHTLTMDNGRILGHTLALLRHEKHVAG